MYEFDKTNIGMFMFENFINYLTVCNLNKKKLLRFQIHVKNTESVYNKK